MEQLLHILPKKHPKNYLVSCVNARALTALSGSTLKKEIEGCLRSKDIKDLNKRATGYDDPVHAISESV